MSELLLPEVRSKHFQMRLGAMPGEVVEGIADVSQCLAVILMTIPGSVPHEPEFGCGLWEYLDRPVQEVQGYLLSEVVKAIRRWEPRVAVTGVLFEFSDEYSGLSVEVRYTLIETTEERVLVLPLGKDF